MPQYKRNILKVYDQATPSEVSSGISWYADARGACVDLSNDTGYPLPIVVGVVAALSPNNKWARNITDARNVLTGPDATVCTYHAMRDKAYAIKGGADIIPTLKGPKITAFYRCIMGENVCVVDGHAFNIAHNKRLDLKNVKVNVTAKVHEKLQVYYQRAAKDRDLLAHEMQAITWTTWRRIHNIK